MAGARAKARSKLTAPVRGWSAVTWLGLAEKSDWFRSTSILSGYGLSVLAPVPVGRVSARVHRRQVQMPLHSPQPGLELADQNPMADRDGVAFDHCATQADDLFAHRLDFRVDLAVHHQKVRGDVGAP